MTESESYDLSVSSKKLGRLYPILKDAHGNIIDGFHRQNADPDWPCLTVDSVTNPQELELARLASNFCRRQIPATELQTRIAFLVGKCGMKPEEIAEKTGISERTIYRHMPQELKDQERSEATKQGMEAKRNLTPDRSIARQPTPEQFTECERCHVATSQPKEWHKHQLCEKCYSRAENNPEVYDGWFHYQERAKNGQVPKVLQLQKPVESWTQRTAQMSPQHSKMEETMLLALQVNGIHNIVQDRQFCLLNTTPDFYFPQANLAVYIDGEEVHGAKQQDRDEQLREMLTKQHDIRVLSVSYSGNSKGEVDRVLNTILEGLQKTET